jgi:hypothetical protein
LLEARLGEVVEGARVKDDPANASFVREGDYALLVLFLVEVLTFGADRFKGCVFLRGASFPGVPVMRRG